jgi:hypothetical protein
MKWGTKHTLNTAKMFDPQDKESNHKKNLGTIGRASLSVIKWPINHRRIASDQSIHRFAVHLQQSRSNATASCWIPNCEA